MAKQVHEIKGFHRGTITTPSEVDIPDDSNISSLNLDNHGTDGNLKGRGGDKLLDLTGFKDADASTPSAESVTISFTNDVDNANAGYLSGDISNYALINSIDTEYYIWWNDSSSTYSHPNDIALAARIPILVVINFATAEDDDVAGAVKTALEAVSGTPWVVSVVTDAGDTSNITITLSDNGNIETIFKSGTSNLSEASAVEGNGINVNAKKINLLSNKNETDIVYIDENKGISRISDLYGETTQTLGNKSLIGNDFSMVAHNKEVHIGTGGAAGTKPQWAGYVSQGNLVTAFKEGSYHVEDDKLHSPGTTEAGGQLYNFTQIIPHSGDAHFLYGVVKGISRIFRINNDEASGSYGAIEVSTDLGYPLDYICECKSATIHSGHANEVYVWAYTPGEGLDEAEDIFDSTQTPGKVGKTLKILVNNDGTSASYTFATAVGAQSIHKELYMFYETTSHPSYNSGCGQARVGGILETYAENEPNNADYVLWWLLCPDANAGDDTGQWFCGHEESRVSFYPYLYRTTLDADDISYVGNTETIGNIDKTPQDVELFDNSILTQITYTVKSTSATGNDRIIWDPNDSGGWGAGNDDELRMKINGVTYGDWDGWTANTVTKLEIGDSFTASLLDDGGSYDDWNEGDGGKSLHFDVPYGVADGASVLQNNVCRFWFNRNSAGQVPAAPPAGVLKEILLVTANWNEDQMIEKIENAADTLGFWDVMVGGSSFENKMWFIPLKQYYLTGARYTSPLLTSGGGTLSTSEDFDLTGEFNATQLNLQGEFPISYKNLTHNSSLKLLAQNIGFCRHDYKRITPKTQLGDSTGGGNIAGETDSVGDGISYRYAPHEMSLIPSQEIAENDGLSGHIVSLAMSVAADEGIVDNGGLYLFPEVYLKCINKYLIFPITGELLKKSDFKVLADWERAIDCNGKVLFLTIKATDDHAQLGGGVGENGGGITSVNSNLVDLSSATLGIGPGDDTYELLASDTQLMGDYIYATDGNITAEYAMATVRVLGDSCELPDGIKARNHQDYNGLMTPDVDSDSGKRIFATVKGDNNDTVLYATRIENTTTESLEELGADEFQWVRYDDAGYTNDTEGTTAKPLINWDDDLKPIFAIDKYANNAINSSTLISGGDTGYDFRIKSLDRTADLNFRDVFWDYESGGADGTEIDDVGISDIANIESFVDSFTGDDSTGNNFVHDTTYYYKVSFTYDGYQESPLTPVPWKWKVVGASDGEGGYLNFSSVFVGVIINITNSRLTHINLYRTDNTNKLYRLATSDRLDSSWTKQGDGTYTKQILDEGSSGASYEAINNMSETLRDTMVHYGISTQLNNELYVAQCWHGSVTGADNYIFKSNPGSFSQFDWAKNFLILPEYPKAIMAFRGRVYAFSSSNMYVINSNLMLEDTYEGIGCLGQKSIIATDSGMCFCDDNNIYLLNKDYPQIISYPIEDTYQTQVDSDTYVPVVTYDTSRHSFVIITQSNSMWLYNIASKRWDNWTTPGGGTIDDAIIGKKGEVMLADNVDKVIYQLAADDGNRKAWSWTSKKLTMGHDTQVKMFKKTRLAGTTIDTIDTFTSSEGGVTETGEVDGAEGYVYTLSGAPSKAKWIQYVISNAPASVTIDAIGTIYRRRAIK